MISRLTLTWDVLKLFLESRCCLFQFRLTLTWDVLKQTEDSQLPFPFPINFNMGCIETALAVGLNLSEVGLTLTWDVLKRAFTLDICASKSD